MKILHISPSFFPAVKYGGPIYSTLELCRHLQMMGHQVDVFTTNANWDENLDVPLARPFNLDGIQIIYFPRIGKTNYIFCPYMKKALRLSIANYDVVHITSMFTYTTLIASRICNKAGIPYVLSPRGALDSYGLNQKRMKKNLYIKIFDIKTIREASCIHVTSTMENNSILALNQFAHTALVPNGIKAEDYQREFRRNDYWNQWGIENNKRVILFLGRLHEKKGIDILIEAFSQLRFKDDNIHLVIAGPDEKGYRKRLEILIEEKNIKKHVTFLGQILDDTKVATLQNSFVLVLPSHGENFGNVVAEALASGTPVIASQNTPWENLEKWKSGFWVANKTDEYVGKLSYLLTHPQERNLMGQKGKEKIGENYNWVRIAQDMYSVYTDVVQNFHLSKGYMLSKMDIHLSKASKNHYEEFPFYFIPPSEKDKLEKSHPKSFRNFVKSIPKHEKVIDIGCGAGRGYFYGIANDVSWIGLDITKKGLNFIKTHDSNATLLQGSAISLPFKDNVSNYVVSDGVIHHTPSAKKSFSEIARICKVNGEIYIAVYKRFRYYYYAYNYLGAILRFMDSHNMRIFISFFIKIYGFLHFLKRHEKLNNIAYKNLFYDYFITPVASFHTKREMIKWGNDFGLKLETYDRNRGGNCHIFIFRKGNL